MQCILCGGQSDFPGMLCEECREALLDYKKLYFRNKKLAETTELDEEEFEQIYTTLSINELIKEDKFGLLSSTVDELVDNVRFSIKESMRDNVWLNGQPGRFEHFIAYIEKRIREDWNKE